MLALKVSRFACQHSTGMLVTGEMYVFGPRENGAPGEIRTPGLLVRSQALYPTELRARKGREYYHINWRAPFR